MRSTRILTSLCWACLVVIGGGSTAVVAAEPVLSGGGPGSGWVAARLELTGQRYTFAVSASGSEGTDHVGYAIFDETGRVVRTLTFTAGDGDHGVFIGSNGERLFETPTGIEVLTGQGGVTIVGTMNDGGMPPESGVYFLALWGAHKAGSWSWNMDGAITVLGQSGADEAIAITSSDLTGPLVAQARPLHRWGGPAAYVGASAAFEIQHTFIGAAEAPLVHANGLVIERPGDTRATCPCYPRDLIGPGTWGPGRYEVVRNGADVVLTGGTDLHVMGVDIELPWP